MTAKFWEAKEWLRSVGQGTAMNVHGPFDTLEGAEAKARAAALAENTHSKVVFMTDLAPGFWWAPGWVQTRARACGITLLVICVYTRVDGKPKRKSVI